MFNGTSPFGRGTGATGFTTGCWRPDRPNAKSALPSGPQAPIVRPEPETCGEVGSRLRDPRTAARLAEHDEALKPRRYVPPTDRGG